MIEFGLFGLPKALEEAMAKSMSDKLDEQIMEPKITLEQENKILWKIIDYHIGVLFELEEKADLQRNIQARNAFAEAQSALCQELISSGFYTKMRKVSS